MRKKIGFLVDWIDTDYQVNLLSGIEIAACAYDLDLITFVGGVLEEPGFTTVYQNDIFSFVSKDIIDGVILSSSSLSHVKGYDKIVDFCRELKPVPVVSIAMVIEGLPSILVDNASGFKDLMIHLMGPHMYRKFIFIQGHEYTNDSIERLRIFISQLREYQIPEEDQKIVAGDFTKRSGYEIIRNMNNDEILKYNAIIASNDEMAWGVLDALHEKGIKVPDEIALTGFDDQMISKYMDPPLTTVSQQIHETGYRAVELLAKLMKGNLLDQVERMETEMVIRSSCGCGDELPESDKRVILDSAATQLRIENEFLQFRYISQRLVNVTNIMELIQLFEQELKNINISFCLFALYEGESLKDHKDLNFRIIFCYEKNKGMIESMRGLKYPAEKLFPDSLFPRDHFSSIFVEPVFFGIKPLGIIFIDQNRRNEVMYNIMLRMFINTALKAAFFVQEVQSKAHQVEYANERLTKTLDTLKRTQEQVIESEKMAALGSLVAGMAHEINTPIGISVTASSYLEKLTEELEQMFTAESMKKSDLISYIQKARESSRMILSNMLRSHELILSFKQVAVDQSVEEIRLFNVSDYIHEILVSLQPQLKKTPHEINIDCPSDINIYGYPGVLYQILSNLIFNSIKHAFNDDEKGLIHVQIKKADSRVHITFSDNGKGIPLEHQKHIFEPFFTTKRTKGGTGLGLHLVFNLVTHKLRGSIDFDSSREKGTEFRISFPVNN